MNKPWFDKECYRLRCKVLHWGKVRIKFSKNREIAKKYNDLACEYRKLLRRKKREYSINEAKKLANLTKNQRDFWKHLKKCNQNNPDDPNPISIDEWASYFEKLTSSTDKSTVHGPVSDTSPSPNNTCESGPDYNSAISTSEIRKAINKLKARKAPGPDIIPSDIYKILSDDIIPCLELLFNCVLDVGCYPKSWNTSYVIPIHKKGSKQDPDNYRCLSVGSAMGKLFNSIINDRLITYLDTNNLLSKTQSGFRNGCRTSDNIFVLNALSKKYLNSKNKKMYTCFVDFSKAFDTVPRSNLFEKMSKNMKIEGKLFNILNDMYSSTAARVKVSNSISKSFDTSKGLKQGCVLSPTLFNIFLADLPDYLAEHGGNPVCLQADDNFICLIYADDVVLIAATEQDLQKSLAALETYSDQWGLKVNVKKTKALTFNKGNRLIKNNLLYKGELIELVKCFKYLGLQLAANGKYTSTIKDLYQRACKAYFGLINNIKFKISDSPLVSLKLFDTLIRPVALYCSEIWGFENNEKSLLEKLHIRFCKQVLGVTRFCSNVAVKAELGRHDLTYNSDMSLIKYWCRIVQLPNDHFLKQAYNYLAQNERTLPKKSWFNRVKHLIQAHGFNSVWMNQHAIKNWQPFIKNISMVISDSLSANMLAKISDSSKLSFYAKFKNCISFETYLSIQNLKGHERIALTKLRLSDHRLDMEKGRYLNKPRNERLCSHCDSGLLGDEVHFLLSCSCLQSCRQKLLFSHFTPKYEHCNNEQFIVDKIISSDTATNIALGKFCYAGFKSLNV